jgi:hypothetical protein
LPSPEPIGRTGSASSRRRVLPSSRAVGCALEGPPASYRPMGSAFPPRGSSTSWSSPAGREPYDRSACLPRPFAPLRSITRSSATPSSGVTGSLEVCSPSAQPNRGEPPLPELPPPGPVASPPFQPASTPCSRRDLPGLFHPGAPSGFSLQSLTWHGSRAPLGVASLPAIGHAASRYRIGHCRIGGTHLPGPASVPRRLSASARGAISGSRVPPFAMAAVTDGGSVTASLQGFVPHAGWEAASVSPRSGGLLALLGFSLPGAFPFPELGLLGRRTRPSPFGAGPRDAPGISTPTTCLRTLSGLPRSASSPVLQGCPLPGSFPCTPEFQRTGKSAGLFRGCRPLRGFHPRPTSVAVARVVRR